MRRLALAILIAALQCAAQEGPLPPPQPAFQGQAAQASTPAKSIIVLPAGTRVPLAMTSPVWSKSAKPGDSVYTQTVFPVAINNQIAIPPGTYVEGQIDTIARPGWFSPHAQFQIHFTKMIFASGYAAGFPSAAPPEDVLPAIASVYAQVSAANDILLDNGTQIEMLLQLPLSLDADGVAAAARMNKRPQLVPSKSATLCRPTPGTPGTSDTVIPGTLGSPGTPPTVIPQGPDLPDIVIPGIPATSGTPDTVIPGTPGTSGTVCPGPPVVISNPKPQEYKESFQANAAVRVAGTQLSPGSYQLKWAGTGPSARVEFQLKKKTVASVPVRIVILSEKNAADAATIRPNPDGSLILESLRFKGQALAIYFDPGAA